MVFLEVIYLNICILSNRFYDGSVFVPFKPHSGLVAQKKNLMPNLASF